MLKDNELIGIIAVYRQEVRPFTEKQIEVVTNFAAQAVIAIENTRLLNELRQRTDDLSESLQQQTATSEILEVISNSPTDSQPAFDAIVRSGLKLFPNAVIAISLPDDDKVKAAAIDGADRADLEALRARYPLPLSREYITSTAILDRREMDFADARDTPAQLIPGGQNFLASGYRAITVMPMTRGELAIGAISVVRRQPGALSDKQRELLRSFANQAVIAIENTRLFNELRESLAQQTATSEVLKVISSSPGDLKPVFNAMLENAARICQAQFGTLNIYDGSAFRRVALHNPPSQFAMRLGGVIRPHPESGLAYVARTKQIAHIDDLRTRQPYLEGDKAAVDLADLAGARTLLVVPMLKEDDAGRRHRHLPPGGPAVHRQANRSGQEFRRPGRHRHRECAAADRTAPAHRRAWPLGRRAARARRGVAGGELDARSRNRALDHRRQGGAALRHRGRRDLRLRRSAARISSARHLRHGSGVD